MPRVPELPAATNISNDDLVVLYDNNGDLTGKATLAQLAASLGGGGDMLASVYDPQEIEGDVFDRTNHTGTQPLSTISDVTASASELNTLDGITATTAELNHTDGVTSNIQTQLDGKQPLDADLTALAAANNSSVLAATTASFTSDDETKLDGIEAGADVTDATNVAAAGAFMKATDDLDDITEGTTNKQFTQTEKTKLSGIETNADVTDATNVAAAGAVMDSDFSSNGLMARTASGTYASRTITGTANQVSVTNGDGASGNPTLSLPQSIHTGATPQFAGIEVGDASDTTLTRSSAGVIAVESVAIPTISSTHTLTNKRVTPRVGTTTSSATPTINTDNVDAFSITALATNITSMTTNLSGTPTDFQKLLIRILDNGSARTIAWGASFASKGATLPTTTTANKLLTVGLIYNSVTALWECVAVAEEA